MNKVFYMDGYHGGIYGHMPFGSIRDILDTMKEIPDWKIHLDIEPVSFDYLKERDLEAYEELSEYINKGERAEIVAGTYGQPYGWITDGESFIRHLILGREVLKKHYPNINIETYAVQEPCWSSFLPQVLLQLGYKQASLKNASTAWGGYCESYIDGNSKTAEIINWAGPDGSFIPTIPRYACEDAVCVYATEARDSTKEWMEKCNNNGIENPTGMYFQDLGWRARTGTNGEHIEFSLIKDYFNNKSNSNIPYWQPGQEIFRCALPWGDKVLVDLSKKVRKLEKDILLNERLIAFASLYGNDKNEEKLKEAWEYLLLTQHHDGWICASDETWKSHTLARVFAAENIIGSLERSAFESLNRLSPESDADKYETVTVFNPLATKEKRIITVDVTAHKGTKGFEVYDNGEKIPSQAIEVRAYRDSTFNAGRVVFEAELPAFGIKTFIIKEVKNETELLNNIAFKDESDIITLENSLVRITFSKKHGGAITSYFDKNQRVELVPKNQFFNEFKGFFINENRFCSSTESPAECIINYAGDMEAALTFKGKISNTPYVLKYVLNANSGYLDTEVYFNFPENTLIGEPYLMDDSEDLKKFDPHRTYHDGRYRLNAYFPTTFKQKFIDKDCAYDVCRSKLTDTHFKSWYEIKHNILIHWVDTTDENSGLCILADHTTAYTHGENENLGLTLAWGYDGGFWWKRRALQGGHRISYRILPHKGNWKNADLWHECEKYLHNPLAKRIPLAINTDYSLLSVETKGIELEAFYTAKGEYYFRVFNAGENTEAKFTIDKSKFCGILPVTPEGKAAGAELNEIEGNFIDVVPPFGIRTYKLIK